MTAIKGKKMVSTQHSNLACARGRTLCVVLVCIIILLIYAAVASLTQESPLCVGSTVNQQCCILKTFSGKYYSSNS